MKKTLMKRSAVHPYLGLLAIFISLAMITNCQQTTCEDLVHQWIESPQTLPGIVYADSGKFLNDLGDYNNCLFNKDEYTYITMRVFNRLVGMQFIGLCAPNLCKQNITSNAYSANITQTLNQIYQQKTKTNFSPFAGLYFYAPDENQPQMDWSNYLTIGLFVLLIFLGIAGSIAGKVTQSNSLPVRVIKSFSFYDNFAKIIVVPKTNQNQNLLFLNGTRVLSIFWIVFGHDMWFRFMNIKNWMETMDILTSPGLVTLVPAAYFAVDTFFWIGAFLVTIGMLQQMKKSKNFLKFYFGCILHRFIRIWPTYMIAILMFWKIGPYLGSGPIWRTYYDISCSCNDGGVVWNMFFLDNFQNHGPSGMDYCFGWGWYLAVDFQLFLITPFILYAYLKNKKLGWLVAFLTFFASVLTAFIMIIVNDWRYPIPNPKMKPQPQFMDQFYYKPYIRASAYIMGIFTGFIYYEWKNKDQTTLKYINYIKKSIPIRVMFYIVGIGLCQFAIWIIVPFQRGQDWSTVAQAFYNSLNRVVFLIGVYLCIFAAMFGVKNDPSKFILGHPFFSPLAKVSFCIYLTHFIIILDGTYSTRMDLYWQPLSSLYLIMSDIFWSVLLALCLSLLIQSPTLGVQRIFLRGDGGRTKKQIKQSAKEKPKLQQPLKSNTIQFKQEGQQIRQSLLTNQDRKSANQMLL